MKKGKEKKENKVSKKQHKEKILKTVEELNRGEIKEKPAKERKPSKYQIAAQYIREHSGQFSRKELIENLEREGICAGTSGAFLSDAKNQKYKPSWLSEDLVEREGKIYLE